MLLGEHGTQEVTDEDGVHDLLRPRLYLLVLLQACEVRSKRLFSQILDRAALAVLMAPVAAHQAAAADWPDHERLTRDQVVAALAAAPGAPVSFYAKNLSDLDLSGIDFKGANLSAAVLNGSNLTGANLSRSNLTVSFAEGANLTNANLRGAMMFSTQLGGAILVGADLSGARLIGDLRRATLEKAVLRNMDAAPDMKNQSMGLMRANLASANLRGADLSGSDFSRGDFSFCDLSGARLVGAKLRAAEFGGTDLRGADLSGADLSGAKLSTPTSRVRISPAPISPGRHFAVSGAWTRRTRAAHAGWRA